jgi:predicted DNA-binding transcriptional regulator AlpA
MPYEDPQDEDTERMTFHEWLAEIIRLEDAAAMAGMGRTTLTKRAMRGDAPLPVRINAKCLVYRKSVIQRWIESRPARNGRSA